MKIILISILLISIIAISGCNSGPDCDFRRNPVTKTDVIIDDSKDAFNTIKAQIELGTLEVLGDKISEDTRKATIDKLQFKNVTFNGRPTSELWVLNGEIGIDKDGNVYLKCGAAI